MTSLWSNINYKAPIKYLSNTFVREYDLSQANINALLYTKRISAKEYKTLKALPKQDREVQIGLMEKYDYSLYQSIKDGITEAKRKLIKANNLEDYDIVAIKNDAVFVISKKLDNIVFPPFEFKMKNEYTMYMQLAELEVYYSDSIDFNTGNINTNIDIKGISDEKLLLHQSGMLGLICEICYRLQRENPKTVLEYVTSMYNDFIQRKLPVDYYRSFDPFSTYTVFSPYQAFSVQDIDPMYINCIDINRNNMIFRELIFIVSDIYRTRSK